MRYYDAHNHLHDERFGGRQEELIAACRAAGIARMVVNGSCEEDWPQVAALARAHPDLIIPSFGYHPWYVNERTTRWLEHLTRCLDETPGSVIGEIGLDRWKPGLSYDGQEDVFAAQLELAAARNLPASIHCLQAWGRMHDLLQGSSRPARGFLLHSYGGSQEMVLPFARLGAYFSLPGYYAHERKSRQRQTFLHVPSDRLLIETDAPDQSLPDVLNEHPLHDPGTGRALNHPANLPAVYRFAAGLLEQSMEALAGKVEENFLRLLSHDGLPE